MRSIRRTEGRCYACEAIRHIIIEDAQDPRCEVCGGAFVEIDVPEADNDFGFQSNEWGQVPALLNMLFGSLTDDVFTRRVVGRGDIRTFPTGFGGLLGAFMTALNEDNFNNILHHIMQNDPGNYGPPPAAQQIRNQLPREQLDSRTAEGDCAVCQESFKPGDIGTRLTRNRDECGHMFHDTCLLPWLEQHNTCPVCRYELPTDDADYEARKAQVRGQLERNLSHRQTPNEPARPPENQMSSHSSHNLRLSPLAPENMARPSTFNLRFGTGVPNRNVRTQAREAPSPPQRPPEPFQSRHHTQIFTTNPTPHTRISMSLRTLSGGTGMLGDTRSNLPQNFNSGPNQRNESSSGHQQHHPWHGRTR